MDEQALIDALRTNPDDDAARLVYADWLEEHGETARAQLLRVQVERKGVPYGGPRWYELEAEERGLHAQCDEAMPLSPRLRKKVRLRWQFGLLAASIEDRAKFIDANFAELARIPNLTSLSAFERLPPDQVPRLAEWPDLHALSTDRPTGLTDAHLQALRDVPQLDALAFYSASLSAGGLAHISVLRGLKKLALRACTFDNTALAPLVALTSLTQLSLESSSVDDDGLAFVSSLRRLKHLHLASTQITDAGLRHLVPLKELTHLDLGGTHVGDEAPATLARMKTLHTLSLAGCAGITHANVMALARAPALRDLDLTWAGVTRVRLPPFLAAAKLERLRVGALLGNPDYSYDNREITAFEEICAEHGIRADVQLVEMDYE